MDILFKKIDEENWEECVELALDNDQVDFVAPNSYSIIEASFNESLFPLAIYNNNKMIGFLMYEKDEVDNDMSMCRLMIDKNYQNKGYGKASTIKLLKFIKETYGSTPFFTSFEPENKVAMKL